MSLLGELINIITKENIPVQTVSFSPPAPDYYAVLTPLSDTFEVFANNRPQQNIEEVRISLFDKGNYTSKKNKLVKALLNADITITDRRYIGYEDDTKIHHYAIDCGKSYEIT